MIALRHILSQITYDSGTQTHELSGQIHNPDDAERDSIGYNKTKLERIFQHTGVGEGQGDRRSRRARSTEAKGGVAGTDSSMSVSSSPGGAAGFGIAISDRAGDHLFLKAFSFPHFPPLQNHRTSEWNAPRSCGLLDAGCFPRGRADRDLLQSPGQNALGDLSIRQVIQQ